ncbi:MAG TPA: hypothetical protein VIJ23_10020 [Mycobacterium sp.]
MQKCARPTAFDERQDGPRVAVLQAARTRRPTRPWPTPKALGLGLRHRFDSFGFTLDAAGAITLADPAQSASEWDLRVTGPLCGHRLAVAVRRGANSLTRYRLVVDAGADGDRDLMPALAGMLT